MQWKGQKSRGNQPERHHVLSGRRLIALGPIGRHGDYGRPSRTDDGSHPPETSVRGDLGTSNQERHKRCRTVARTGVSSMFIELCGIGKYYRTGGETTEVLQDINLRIDQSEFIAITGPSGSGKTTLAHTIGGLVRPDRGEVVIEGRALNTRDDSKVSRYRNEFIGFVFQNYGLLPRYTVLENVLLPLMIAKVKPKRRKAIAMSSLTSVGLGSFANRYANELSGGQRQRVAIARAIAHEPKLIIADEPTGNLDSAKGREIMTMLQALSREKGITIVVVTHDLELAGLADRIIHLKDGAISGAGHAY